MSICFTGGPSEVYTIEDGCYFEVFPFLPHNSCCCSKVPCAITLSRYSGHGSGGEISSVTAAVQNGSCGLNQFASADLLVGANCIDQPQLPGYHIAHQGTFEHV